MPKGIRGSPLYSEEMVLSNPQLTAFKRVSEDLEALFLNLSPPIRRLSSKETS